VNEANLISKVWNFANVLRDDGVGYGDYLEQITYLLFLKMADEMSKPPIFKLNMNRKFRHIIQKRHFCSKTQPAIAPVKRLAFDVFLLAFLV
jgi:type I restriction-modification system DNA methylase subunit